MVSHTVWYPRRQRSSALHTCCSVGYSESKQMSIYMIEQKIGQGVLYLQCVRHHSWATSKAQSLQESHTATIFTFALWPLLDLNHKPYTQRCVYRMWTQQIQSVSRNLIKMEQSFKSFQQKNALRRVHAIPRITGGSIYDAPSVTLWTCNCSRSFL
jgi:hypothetical protein